MCSHVYNSFIHQSVFITLTGSSSLKSALRSVKVDFTPERKEKGREKKGGKRKGTKMKGIKKERNKKGKGKKERSKKEKE